MKYRFLGLALVLAAAVTLLGAPAHAATSWLSGHVQNVGWTDARVQADGDRVAEVGTTGRSLRLEALRVNDSQSGLVMRGHVQNIGWGAESSAVGTTGRSLRLEAVQVRSVQPGVVVHCQAHVQNLGWMPEVTDGATCGTTGRSLRMEAVRLWVTIPDPIDPSPGPSPSPSPSPDDVTRLNAVGDIGPEGFDNLAAIGRTGNPLLLLGDLGYTISAQEFCTGLNARVSAPVMWVQGNHENVDAKNPTQLTAEYRKCMPGFPDSAGDVGVAQVYKLPHVWVITGSPNEAEPGTYQPGGARWTWMRDQIRAAHAAGVWPVLAVHEPDYTVGAHGRPPAGSEQKAISALAKAEGVRLVLTGHDHNYSRVQVDGVTFIVAGMGGHENRPPTPTAPYVSCAGAPAGYLALEFGPDRITGQVIGTCTDVFTITKG